MQRGAIGANRGSVREWSTNPFISETRGYARFRETHLILDTGVWTVASGAELGRLYYTYTARAHCRGQKLTNAKAGREFVYTLQQALASRAGSSITAALIEHLDSEGRQQAVVIGEGRAAHKEGPRLH